MDAEGLREFIRREAMNEIQLRMMLHLAAAVLTNATEVRLGSVTGANAPDPTLQGADKNPLIVEVDQIYKVWVFFIFSALQSKDWPTMEAFLKTTPPPSPVPVPAAPTVPAKLAGVLSPAVNALLGS